MNDQSKFEISIEIRLEENGDRTRIASLRIFRVKTKHKIRPLLQNVVATYNLV